MRTLALDFAPLPPAIGVAVSGGADSVALLRLLRERSPDRRLVVIHINHQLRREAADDDERFVCDLASTFGLACFVRYRAGLEATPDLPTNASARYRAMRLAAYREAMKAHQLDAVALAHHADDQAETILLRLVRGGGWPALRGMSERATVGGVPIVRPLLGVRRNDLRSYLQTIGQPWREDASNASPTYRRNVARQVLTTRPALTAALLELADQGTTLHAALHATAPPLPETFPRHALERPRVVAEHLCRRWLIDHGAPADGVSPASCERLIIQARDVTAPARQHYPGGICVRRRAGQIFVHSDAGLSTSSDRSS